MLMIRAVKTSEIKELITVIQPKKYLLMSEITSLKKQQILITKLFKKKKKLKLLIMRQNRAEFD